MQTQGAQRFEVVVPFSVTVRGEDDSPRSFDLRKQRQLWIDAAGGRTSDGPVPLDTTDLVWLLEQELVRPL